MASDMQPQQRMQPAVIKVQLTLTTLIILFTAMTVFASPPPAVGLWIESAFNFKRCSEDQKNFFRSTVNSGLAAIADLNPELLNNRLSLSTTVRAEIVCSGKKIGSPLIAAQTTPEARVFGIKVQSNSLNLSNSFQTSDEDGIVREETVLHEVLHLLKFDNFPTQIHNDTGFLSYSNRTSLKTRMPGSNLDVVYSCAIAAFPELERKYTRQIDEKLERSIQTCKAARIIGDRVDILARDLPFLRLERADGDRSVICFLDQITHFYDPIVKPDWLRTIRSVCTPEK